MVSVDQQILDHLREELPGFEGHFDIERDRHQVILRVRTNLRFAAESRLDDLRLPAPYEGPNDEVIHWVEGLIKSTRLDAIGKLGLDKEIEAQVEERAEREVANRAAAIRQAAYQDAYRAAYADAFRAALAIKGELSDDSAGD